MFHDRRLKAKTIMYLWPVHASLCQKLFHRTAVRSIQTNTEKLQLTAELIVNLFQLFKLLHAGRTPCGPEMDPHVHCLVPGGGLSEDGARWIACRPGFFLPVRVLSKLFRGKFLARLRAAFESGDLSFHGQLAELGNHVVFESLLDTAFCVPPGNPPTEARPDREPRPGLPSMPQRTTPGKRKDRR